MHKQAIYGLPINPRHLLNELAGASFCISYATRDRLGSQLEDAIRLVGEDGILLVDNGAFSLHKKGVSARDEAYIEGYEAWALDILARCPQAIAVFPDIIGGTVEDNWRLVCESQLPFDRAMPIWHMHEPISYLIHMCDAGFDYVGIGSSGDYWQVGSPKWHARLTEALDAIEAWERQGNDIRPRLHMMRAQSQAHLYALDSADSTNVAMNHCRYKSEGEGYVGRFADRVSAKIKASSGAEAEHQLKRPLLGHLESAAWEAQRLVEWQAYRAELEAFRAVEAALADVVELAEAA